jgi:pimeloyl-ACP methyl ester carboxylesterase
VPGIIRNPRRRRALLSACIVLGLLVVLFRPVSTAGLIAQPRPAASYATALQRFEQLQARDTDVVNPLCHSRLLTHGRRSAQAIVFLHGFTNCPQQFAQLGQIFYDLGYNVLIPRLPHHGLRDRMTEELAQLRAEELVALTDEALGITQGLGAQVTVVGLSGGGVMAAWAAQLSPAVTRVVSIAPVYGREGVPAVLLPSLSNAALMLPNRFLWWDSALKEQRPAPPHAYQRFPTHALAELLRLGLAVQEAAQQQRPLAPSIVVVTNAADRSVDNAVTDRLTAAWQARGAAVQRYVFPAEQGLIHDIIDPTNPRQQVDLVYPPLVALIHGDPLP